MASTTLVTFIFQAPKPVARVELLGSWDNFRKPYPMQRDRSSGGQDWRGCHSFTDIVCDGDALDDAEVKRDGGLKMGGTYWYYYRLDDDSECYNPKEPATTACPLLPGQHVNVLEVPIQMPYPNAEENPSLQSLAEQVFTLDPANKFVAPKPPSPGRLKRFRITKTHRSRTVSRGESALSKLTRWTKELCVQSRPSSPHLEQSRPCSRKRRSSAPVYSDPMTSSSLKEFRRYQSAQAYVKAWVPGRETAMGTSELAAQLGLASTTVHAEPPSSPLSVYSRESYTSMGIGVADTTDETSAQYKGSELDKDQEVHEGALTDRLANRRVDDQSLGNASDSQPSRRITAYSKLKRDSEFTIASSSKRTSGVFSLSESMTGYTDFASPQHYSSQPLTPSVSDFGEFLLEAFHLEEPAGGQLNAEDISRRSSGFTGYNLPDQHASAVTLRADPTTRSKRPPLETAFRSRELVEKWNDGSDRHQKSALQDLVDEAGYLSSLIG